MDKTLTRKSIQKLVYNKLIQHIIQTTFYFNSYRWPLGEIIGRATLHGVPSSIYDCVWHSWPLQCHDNGKGVDNGNTSGNGDGTDDVEGTVGDGEEAINRDEEDVTGGNTCFSWEGKLTITSNKEDVVVGTTPPNWVGIFTLVGDREVIGVGVRLGIVILST